MLIRRSLVRAHGRQDLSPQLGDSMRITTKLIKSPRQCRSGSITTSKQHSNDLIAENLAVSREAGQGVQKRVPVVVLGLGGELLWAQAKSPVNVLVDEVVDDGETVPEAGLGVEVAELAGAGDDVLDVLDLVEGLCELLPRVSVRVSGWVIYLVVVYSR